MASRSYTPSSGKKKIKNVLSVSDKDDDECDDAEDNKRNVESQQIPECNTKSKKGKFFRLFFYTLHVFFEILLILHFFTQKNTPMDLQQLQIAIAEERVNFVLFMKGSNIKLYIMTCSV
jgi:hypothetical protein